MEFVVPIHHEFADSGFQPYALDLHAAGLAEDESACLVFVVMVRNGGALLALPELALSEDVLHHGATAGEQDLVGPHLYAYVPGATFLEDSPLLEPALAQGQEVGVVFVDFTSAIAAHLSPVASILDLDGLLLFDQAVSSLVPAPQALVQRALQWAAEPQDVPRIQFYSADEEVGEPGTPGPAASPAAPKASPSKPRRKAPAGGTGGGVSEPRKRATVASLAENVQMLTDALPMLTQQVQDLTQRTAAIEKSGQAALPERLSALRRPLGTSGTLGLLTGAEPKELVQKMPPPRSTLTPGKQPAVTFTEAEVAEATLDYQGESSLALAVLEQSKALTALVGQIAAGDGAVDLSSSSSALSSKGSLGRQRLQAELASHKGTFFLNVIQNMSRRMYPGQNAEVDLQTLSARGVTASQYLERYGGFGKVRDLGFLAWQVSLCMNYLQDGNVMAAQDSLSLLFVCLEQAAMDGGKLDIGLLLALVEDPPQTLFSGRSLAASVNPRPFAPTANQRWATVALQYLREMDTLASRRTEATSKTQGGGAGGQQAGGQGNAQTKPTPKKKGGKGPGKAKQKSDAEEDVQA